MSSGGANLDQLNLNARGVNIVGVDLVSWLKTLQIQNQQLQLQVATQSAQIAQLQART